MNEGKKLALEALAEIQKNSTEASPIGMAAKKAVDALSAGEQPQASGEDLEALAQRAKHSHALITELNSGSSHAAIRVFMDIAEQWARTLTVPAPQLATNLREEVETLRRPLDPMENDGDMFGQGFNYALDTVIAHLQGVSHV